MQCLFLVSGAVLWGSQGSRAEKCRRAYDRCQEILLRNGEWVAVPCQRGDIWITRPEVIHGATPSAEGQRRAVLSWFTGIQHNNHEALENTEPKTWSRLAICHRTLHSCPAPSMVGTIGMIVDCERMSLKCIDQNCWCGINVRICREGEGV